MNKEQIKEEMKDRRKENKREENNWMNKSIGLRKKEYGVRDKKERRKKE